MTCCEVVVQLSIVSDLLFIFIVVFLFDGDRFSANFTLSRLRGCFC